MPFPDPHPTSARLRAARFYGILDAAYLAPAQFAPACRALLAGGADIVQVRAKGVDKDSYRRLLESVLPQFENNDIPLIVNDHLDVALEYPRCGLHIGQDDTPVVSARAALGPNRIVGLSTHSEKQAADALEMAGLLSYFCVGPVFATRTKPDYTPVGLQLVKAVTNLNAEKLPLFCIGGINRANAVEVKAAGATRIVVVSDVLHALDPEKAVRQLRATFA
ncbi:MAG TPA: thiamine phosphate synthase [Opitutales bacterium]|nr:thiamine phosphate synthase [Opitutales bacterium]